MGILWCETHLKSYNPLIPNQGLMEKIASFLRLVQFNSFDFFLMCCWKKKSKLQNCNKRMQTKSTCLWMKNAFQVGKKNPKREAKKILNKINISSFKSRLCFRKKLREKSKLELLQMKLKEENVGCMYVCMFYPNWSMASTRNLVARASKLRKKNPCEAP